jgi:hypothetical protein
MINRKVVGVRLFFVLTVGLLINVVLINNNNLVSAGTQTEETEEQERQTHALSSSSTSQPSNSAPEAKGGVIRAESGKSVVINLEGYDVDSDETLTTQIESEPTYGKLTDLDKENAIVTYTSNSDFEGTDVFSFIVNDGKTDSRPAEVVIIVSPPPNNPPEAIGGTVETVTGDSTIIYVVWSEGEEDLRHIFFKRIDAEGGEGNVMKLTEGSPSASFNPQVAAYGSNVYVVWQADYRSTGNQDIFLRKSSNIGTTFDDTINLSNDAAGSGNPDVTAQGSNVYVTWGGTTPGDNDIFYKRSTNYGTTFKSTKNLSNNGGISFLPKVKALGSNVEVLWLDTERGRNDDVFSKKSSDFGNNFGATKKGGNFDEKLWGEKFHR